MAEKRAKAGVRFEHGFLNVFFHFARGIVTVHSPFSPAEARVASHGWKRSWLSPLSMGEEWTLVSELEQTSFQKWRPDKADVFIVGRAVELLLQGLIKIAPFKGVDYCR